MGALGDAVQKVGCHAEYMPHGEHGHHIVSLPEFHFAATEKNVREQAAVGEHHSFGKAGRSRSVVDDGHFLFAAFRRITDIVHGEEFGVFSAEKFVQMPAGVIQIVRPAGGQGEIAQAKNAFEGGHGVLVQVFPYLIAYKEQTGFGMVDDIMYVVRFEFMENGNNDGSIREGGQKSHAPVAAVAAAQGDFVAGTDTCRFHHQMQFLDFTGHVFVLKGFAVEVRQGFQVPVLSDAVFNEFYQGWFHSSELRS